MSRYLNYVLIFKKTIESRKYILKKKRIISLQSKFFIHVRCDYLLELSVDEIIKGLNVVTNKSIML